MIVTGFVLVGLAVGADIPASWSLIAELAPDTKRGKHSGMAQILWSLGPVVVLLGFLVLEPLGLLGARIIFAHLALLALALTMLRSRMSESEKWEAAAKLVEVTSPAQRNTNWRVLVQPPYLKSLLFLSAMYGLWNLWAGTNGFFFPYILRTVGAQTQGMSVALQAAGFLFAMLSIYFVFMKYADKVNQRLLFGISTLMQMGGMALLAIFPLTSAIALIYLFLTMFGSGFGAQPFFQLWSAEQFPTLVRSTAQGIGIAIVRISTGIFSFFVPALVSAGFTALSWTLAGFLAASGLVGLIWGPRNEGKSLEELDRARRRHLKNDPEGSRCEGTCSRSSPQ